MEPITLKHSLRYYGPNKQHTVHCRGHTKGRLLVCPPSTLMGACGGAVRCSGRFPLALDTPLLRAQGAASPPPCPLSPLSQPRSSHAPQVLGVPARPVPGGGSRSGTGPVGAEATAAGPSAVTLGAPRAGHCGLSPRQARASISTPGPFNPLALGSTAAGTPAEHPSACGG